MTFNEAIGKLGIEEYSERIFHSNSHGELFHLEDYILLAESFDDLSWFKDWFDSVVRLAEENWQRPESVFQHIPQILEHSLQQIEMGTDDGILTVKHEESVFISNYSNLSKDYMKTDIYFRKEEL